MTVKGVYKKWCMHWVEATVLYIQNSIGFQLTLATSQMIDNAKPPLPATFLPLYCNSDNQTQKVVFLIKKKT